MSKFDSLLKKAELFEKLAIYGDRKIFLEALGQSSIFHPDPETNPQVTDYTKRTTIPPPPPPETIVAKPPQFTSNEPEPKATPAANYPTIAKETQDQLNALLVPSGNIFPLTTDSKLGPKTQKAMEIFKAKFNMPATPQNIKLVYQRENPQYTTKPGFENKNPL